MPTCDLGFDHPEPAEPAVIPVPVDPGPNENDVRIAEIEAAASIEREQIYTQQQALELAAENERLRGELSGMKSVLNRVVPEPPDPAELEPVIVAPPAPAEPAEETAAPADVEHKAPKSKNGGGYWDGYDLS
jgi:hypothetical protein